MVVTIYWPDTPREATIASHAHRVDNPVLGVDASWSTRRGFDLREEGSDTVRGLDSDISGTELGEQTRERGQLLLVALRARPAKVHPFPSRTSARRLS